MDNMGMLATAINALALQDCLIRLGVPSVVMSAVPMHRFCDEFTARGAVEALENGKVVLFAAGSGCPYFSTDTAATLRALEIKADALLLAKTRVCPEGDRARGGGRSGRNADRRHGRMKNNQIQIGGTPYAERSIG